MNTKKLIMVGTGGFGAYWCAHFLPPNIKDGLIEVVAAVDISPDALAQARKHLGLTAAQCYSDVKKAMDENPADFCVIVVPPAYHEAIVDEALAHNLDILSEKPIADTLEASKRIAAKVKQAGKKMAVTMSHRFDQDKTTFRQLLRSGEYGELDYLVSRLNCNYRYFGTWGKFRHEIDDVLMVEAAVHQLDFLADMSAAKCQTLYAQTWNPRWGEFAGDSEGVAILTMENGVRIIYESAMCTAAGLNYWTRDYVRAECEKATVILNHRGIEVFHHDPEFRYGEDTQFPKEGQGKKIPLLEQPKWSNTWLIECFVEWLNGGEPMETEVQANLQSIAMVFAGIESSKTGLPVKVQALLENNTH